MFNRFAGIALVLVSIGLYAVIAHSASQRTQELGIRMAIGLPAAFGVTHVLRMVLIGVSPSDPVTFLMVVLVLGVAGALECAIPARRATRVDPIVALRYE